ncbi:SusC/RagA family TonB-linked outer membrane protein [Microbacter margulisiae]|uniref:TonB-linked SusC/RagA family outer membrane protein n=1 Tax=Microbacter margulisiae TaxID=1350067 RepID=A0A7W5DS87_9PORP|nr:TonB-dependent receptor [Microbacter margulisiae]MBB3188127.1 TonB-linked SusC/RagA family outer membrane protein [Microbacter margulisiae]
MYTVKGKVFDEKNMPMIGATVVVKGDLKIGTVTDVDGRFTLNVPMKQPVIVISYVGYKPQEIDTKGKNFFTVDMIPNNVNLNDVVVVGYGQEKKQSVVGAIVQTSGKQLAKSVGLPDLGSALTGNLPGVITMTTTGKPGDETPQILIRGESTWNNTSPLILVDGIERDINSVNINDVESISVLKDASATAVFGVRGANGVILITTKRGEEGKANISVTVNTTVKMPQMLASKYDSYDALSIRNESIERELGLYPAAWGKYMPNATLNEYRNQTTLAQAEQYPNINWQDALVRKAAMDHNVNMNISGGTPEVKYFTSVDYEDEGDILKHYPNGKGYTGGYGFKRLDVRSNLDFNLTRTTTLKADLAGSYGVVQDAYNQDSWEYRIWQSIYSNPPDVYYPRYSDGSWGYYPPNTVGTINSALTLSNNGIRYTTTKQINTDFTLKQDLSMILDGLSAQGMLSYDNTFVSVGGIYDNGNVQQTYIDPVTGEVTQSSYLGTNQFNWIPSRWSPNADADVSPDATYRHTFYQLQLNYAKKFGKHDVTGMGLFSRDQYATGSEVPHYREDWVGRFTYNYAEKYFAEVNGAYNGSEQFGPSHRFAFFPSAALGWMITNEKFMKPMKFLDMLKLRASWGQVGSDNMNGYYNRWLYMTSWGYGGTLPLGTNPYASNPYQWWYVTQQGNSDIHWEKVTKTNAGVDYAFLGGLVAGNFDVFRDIRTDILMTPTVPSYFGTTPAAANLGIVRNIGYELVIRLNKQINKNLRLWGNFDMTHARNQVIYADDPQLYDAYRKSAGKPVGQNYSYVTGGYYNNWDQVYGSTQLNTYDTEKLPGNLNIIDFNGDGKIDNKDSAPYSYPSYPENTFTTTVGCDWKAFSLSVMFYGVNDVSRYMQLTSFSGSLDNVYKQGSYWTKTDQNGNVPMPRWDSHMDYTGSTLYLYDGSYLRLKNVQLAYTFKKEWLQKYGINSLRAYLNGEDLFLWTHMPDSREVNTAGSTAYPLVKRITCGLNVTF